MATTVRFVSVVLTILASAIVPTRTAPLRYLAASKVQTQALGSSHTLGRTADVQGGQQGASSGSAEKHVNSKHQLHTALSASQLCEADATTPHAMQACHACAEHAAQHNSDPLVCVQCMRLAKGNNNIQTSCHSLVTLAYDSKHILRPFQVFKNRPAMIQQALTCLLHVSKNDLQSLVSCSESGQAMGWHA